MKSGIMLMMTLLLIIPGSGGCQLEYGERIEGSGELSERTFAVSDFSVVQFTTEGKLHIVVGEREELVLATDENLFQYIEAEVKGETLVIRRQPRVNLKPTQGIHFELTVKNLDAIQNSGSGDINLNELQTESFKIKLNGSGDVEVRQLQVEDVDIQLTGSGSVEIGDLTAREASVHISGSGDIQAAGSGLAYQNVRINGSGDYDGRDLKAAEAKVKITGSGSARVHVADKLDVTITGSGDVHYWGNPEVEKSIHGSGDLRAR
jgi:hypothetical protein